MENRLPPRRPQMGTRYWLWNRGYRHPLCASPELFSASASTSLPHDEVIRCSHQRHCMNGVAGSPEPKESLRVTAGEIIHDRPLIALISTIHQCRMMGPRMDGLIVMADHDSPMRSDMLCPSCSSKPFVSVPFTTTPVIIMDEKSRDSSGRWPQARSTGRIDRIYLNSRKEANRGGWRCILITLMIV
jgi:hypothetical protein